MRRSVFKIRLPCTFLYKLLSVHIFQPRLNAAHFFKILHSGLGNYEAGVSVQALNTVERVYTDSCANTLARYSRTWREVAKARFWKAI